VIIGRQNLQQISKDEAVNIKKYPRNRGKQKVEKAHVLVPLPANSIEHRSLNLDTT
jgi:hypothetical protein